MKIFPLLLLSAQLFRSGSPSAMGFAQESLRIPDSAKVTISPTVYPGLTSPNPRGWYYKCANIVATPKGVLVACWQLSDNHTSLTSYIVVTRSLDGGRTWGDVKTIAHANVWVDHAIWVVPQMSRLADGRILIVCDRGERTPGQDLPMLSTWQQKERGMSNYIWWSGDDGLTWSAGEKVDDVGGEPGYPLDLGRGAIAFTRTSSKATSLLHRPPAPWNNIYYRNEIVISRDNGRTWNETHWLSDDPFHGDCEVGLAQLSAGNLMAASRIGLGNGKFGHPSRLFHSSDNGVSWDRGEVAPFYGQRPHLGQLQSGKMLVTYRNVWGTAGTRALLFDPEEKNSFQPTSWIVDESCCRLESDELVLKTSEGKREAVEFNLYPAEDENTMVQLDFTLKVEAAELNGCAVSAGCWIRFLPQEILADRPEDRVKFDTTAWHDYRVLRQNGKMTLWADGAKLLDSDIHATWAREVRFGNKAAGSGSDNYTENRAVSHWRKFAAKVNNANDYSMNWTWTPAQGYPDQFRRDRTVVLDYAYSADCGYSSWTQMADGRIIIVDYTNGGNLDSFVWGGVGEGAAPFIRGYLVTEKMLSRN